MILNYVPIPYFIYGRFARSLILKGHRPEDVPFRPRTTLSALRSPVSLTKTHKLGSYFGNTQNIM